MPSVETKRLSAYSMKMPSPPKGLESRGQRLKWARETFQRLRGERDSARAFAIECDVKWTEEGDLSLGEVELPFVVANDCFWLEARGASQYPRVKDGEIVIARWLSDMPEHYIGREVVLKTEDGTYLLKTLKRHDGDGHFTIGSHNAPDVENVPVERVAEVVSIVPQHQWKRIG